MPRREAIVPVTDVPTARMEKVIELVASTIDASVASTWTRGLDDELGEIVQSKGFADVRGGCELMRLRLAGSVSSNMGMGEVRKLLGRRCREMLKSTRQGPNTIVNNLLPFIRDTSLVLVFGNGELLTHCVANAITKRPGVRFLLAEGSRMGADDRSVGEELHAQVMAHASVAESGMDRETLSRSMLVVPDAAVAGTLTDVSFAIIGANAVTEHGAVVHATGSLQLAIVAQALNVPLYAVAETFKFTHIFPLTTADLYKQADQRRFTSALSTSLLDVAGDSEEALLAVEAAAPKRAADAPAFQRMEPGPVELVAPSYVSFLFTEKGIMPPSAVADEMLTMRMASQA